MLKMPKQGLDDALVILAFVLGDVELCVQVVQKRVSAFLTQWVVYVRLA